MIKKLSFFASLILAFNSLVAQTTLTAGDIAFVMVNATDNSLNSASNDDNVSFVLLKNITAGTQISFTDFGWRSDSPAFQSANPCGASTGAVTDGVVTWTANTSLPYGTIIHMNVRNNPSVNKGTIAGTTASYNSTINPPIYYVSLSAGAGESVIAFQGTLASPTLISAIRLNSSWSTTLLNCDFTPTGSIQPSALSASGNSFLWGQVGGNGVLKSSVVFTGNKTTDLANIYNVSNWNFNPTVAFQISTSFLGTSEQNTSKKFNIYPIPAKNTITVGIDQSITDSDSKYSIYDGNGKIVLTGKILKTNQKISIEKLSKGIYFLQIKNNKESISKKFLKD